MNQERNEEIIKLFSELLPRKEKLLAKVKAICAAPEQNATNTEPTLNDQISNLELVESDSHPFGINNSATLVDTLQKSPIDDINNATEPLLGSDDLTDEQKDRIVEFMHKILPLKIRILRDNGLGSWICVEKAVENGGDRIYVYSPHKNFQSNGFKDEDQQIIDELYGNSDWRPREYTVFKQSLKATRPQDEFIFILAYALCRAMGQPISGFQNALDGTNTQYVRNEIVQLVRLPALPQLGDNVENWELAKNGILRK